MGNAADTKKGFTYTKGARTEDMLDSFTLAPQARPSKPRAYSVKREIPNFSTYLARGLLHEEGAYRAPDLASQPPRGVLCEQNLPIRNSVSAAGIQSGLLSHLYCPLMPSLQTLRIPLQSSRRSSALKSHSRRGSTRSRRMVRCDLSPSARRGP